MNCRNDQQLRQIGWRRSSQREKNEIHQVPTKVPGTKIHVPKPLHPHNPQSLGTTIPSQKSWQFASRFPSLWFQLLCGKEQDQAQGMELGLGEFIPVLYYWVLQPQVFGIQPSHTLWCHTGANARVCVPSPSSMVSAVPGTQREEECWLAMQEPELRLRQCFFLSRWY